MTTFTTKLDVGLLLESATWPSLLVDPRGIIRRANKAAIELFGPILASNASSISTILAGDKTTTPDKFLAELERAPASSLPLGYRSKDGAITVVPTSICAFTREGEKRFLFQLHGPGQTVAPAQPKPEAAAAPKPEAPAAKQKVDTATQLARSVALDLNNTLTSIMGHCSWILAQMEPDHKWRKSLEEITRAAAKSAEIAQNLAAFSRSDKEREAAVASNVNALLKRLQQEFAKVDDRKIDWCFNSEEQLYTARCEENKLHQLFTRILDNALQSGAQTPKITLQTRNTELEATLHDANLRLQPGCYICVEITDNGKGIPSDILPRIFEPFFTTKPGHKGLGLAWVYGAITNAGGGIAVSSVQNQGTTVRVYVPAHKRVFREASGTPSPDAGAGKTILLVDDEDLVLSVGQTVLSASGYKVITVNNAQKALKVLEEQPGKIDLAIVDWIMPNFSGKELMETIRAEYPSLPVLCTSGYANVPGNKGNTDFLQKPFTTQKLLQRVKDKLTAPEPSAIAA